MNQPNTNQPKITMYTRPDCPDVGRAAYYLRERGLTWNEIDIDADEDARNQVIAWTGRAVTPTIWIGETMLVEPGVAEIDAALAQEA